MAKNEDHRAWCGNSVEQFPKRGDGKGYLEFGSRVWKSEGTHPAKTTDRVGVGPALEAVAQCELHTARPAGGLGELAK